MKPSEERVLEMVAEGQISAAEGDRLLGAMRPARPPWWRVLLDPAGHVGTGVGVAISVGLVAAGVALSRLGVRFDGALDVHVVSAVPSWSASVLDALVAWPLFAAVMWGAARTAKGGGRLVDFLVVVGVARLPLVALGAFSRWLIDDPAAMAEAALRGELHGGLLVVALASLPVLGWFFVWLFTGFRTVSDLRGGRVALAFVGALLVAEVAGKVLLALFT